jgi:hypothetical protein
MSKRLGLLSACLLLSIWGIACAEEVVEQVCIAPGCAPLLRAGRANGAMAGAQTALQAQVDELLETGTLPSQVVSLSPVVKRAALEWLEHGVETEAYYVLATLRGKDEFYTGEYRCRFVVGVSQAHACARPPAKSGLSRAPAHPRPGGSYSLGAASRPPAPQFLDRVESLAVGQQGRLQIDIFAAPAAWTPADAAPSLRRALLFAGAVLAGALPEQIFGRCATGVCPPRGPSRAPLLRGEPGLTDRSS